MQEITLNAVEGRVALTFRAIPVGRDWCILLTGGEAHIGAVALAPSQNGFGLSCPGHRESELAQELTATLKASLPGTVAVVCGIHLERIQPTEIATVLQLARDLAGRFLDRLVHPESQSGSAHRASDES